MGIGVSHILKAAIEVWFQMEQLHHGQLSLETADFKNEDSQPAH
jgi:hypothetical protein